MFRIKDGSLRLFRLAGIDVLVHWSWLLIAGIEIYYRKNAYQSDLWNVAEYLSLFAAVLLHEFGHALACRQVGGTADRVILWPLGGLAMVNPPPRPGALLWCIAAGPLVNLVLVPIVFGLGVLSGLFFSREALSVPFDQLPDVFRFFITLSAMNVFLLLINLLPVYPLDGGQILQAILWFFVGRARSLMVVSVIGLVGGLLLLGLTLTQSVLLVVFVAFILLRSWIGLKHAQILLRMEKGERRCDLACPSCGQSPPEGEFWICELCKKRRDPFVDGGSCSYCEMGGDLTQCAFCNERHPTGAWYPKAEGLACPACGKAPPVGRHWSCTACRTRLDPFERGAACPKCQSPILEASCLYCKASRTVGDWFPEVMPVAAAYDVEPTEDFRT